MAWQSKVTANLAKAGPVSKKRAREGSSCLLAGSTRRDASSSSMVDTLLKTGHYQIQSEGTTFFLLLLTPFSNRYIANKCFGEANILSGCFQSLQEEDLDQWVHLQSLCNLMSSKGPKTGKNTVSSKRLMLYFWGPVRCINRSRHGFLTWDQWQRTAYPQRQACQVKTEATPPLGDP